MARILIIEDDLLVRGVVRDVLEEAGHQVDEASDGEEGVARYGTRRFDLVITDILMPKRGGLNVIREIRRLRPRAKVIAISGGGKDGKLSFLSTARSFGGVVTLAKPFQHQELLAKVGELLETE